MIQRPVAVGDVSLDEPHRPGPGIAYSRSAVWHPRPFRNPCDRSRTPAVVRLQKQADHLADELAGPVRQAEGPELPVLLRDIDAAGRRGTGTARAASAR